jgi:hypothetical protein
VSRPAVVGTVVLLLVVPSASSAALNPSPKPMPAGPRTPSSEAKSALFDGRAAVMRSLDPVGGSGHASQDPVLWDCVCYVNGNIKLVSDTRYGKAYRYFTDDSAWNGWAYDPGPNVGTSELGELRPQGLGHWDWYALAVKIPFGWRQPTWALLFEPNFPAWTSPPEGLNASPRNRGGSYCWRYSAACKPWFNFVRSVGVVGSTNPEHHWLRPVQLGKWTEFVMGIKWATDRSGAYRVYSRVSSDRKVSFKLNAAATGVVTYQTKAGTAAPATTVDLQLLYEGTEPTNGWPSPLWGNTIYQRGFQRFSDKASALAAFRKPRRTR